MFDIKYTQNKYRNTDELGKIVKGKVYAFSSIFSNLL